MKLDKLKKYCEENEIFVPSGATKSYFESAIARHFLHKKEIKLENCFGFWERNCSECLVCDFEERCKTVSLGMEQEKYFKKLKRTDKKIRI